MTIKSEIMLRKLLLITTVMLVAIQSAFSQVGQGTIKGTITNGDDGEPVPFVNVVLYKGSDQVMGVTTDFDGKYTLKPVSPGIYDLQISYVGFQTRRINGIEVNADRITRQNVPISQGVELKEVEIIDYKKPLIEIDKTETGKTITHEEIQRMAVRDINGISRTAGNGVLGRDGSGTLNVRGQRGGANTTFIDGVKAIGATNIPQSAIEEVSVKTGGLSAQYGDATGAIRTITTRGGFKEYFFGAEAFSSGVRIGDNVHGLDNWGNNLLALSFGGPLLTKKDENGKVAKTILDFFLTSEFRTNLGGSSPTKIFKPKDDVEQLIRQNPYIFNGETNSLQQRAELLTRDDFEEVDFRQNSSGKSVTVNGKFRYQISDLSDFTFGGTLNHNFGDNFSYAFSLFNYENNSESFSTQYRVWGRYTKRFENIELVEGEEDNSVVKNAFFSVQVDFSRNSGFTQDARHKENFFDYGYIGRFDARTRTTFAPGTARLPDGRVIRGQFLTAFDGPISYDFTPGDKNPILANYTSDFYSFIPEGDPRRRTRVDVEGAGGIVNGQGGVSGNVYNMWTSPGVVPNGFSKNETDQIRLTGRGSADIGDHEIMLGFEYEQRIVRNWGIAPVGLWTLGRLSVNSHILELDSNNFSVGFQHPNPILPTVTFERKFNEEQRTSFAYNVRRALGFDPDSKTFIDFDSYDPSLYNIDFFATDELLNPTSGVGLGMLGYSKTGKKLSTSTTLDDFFNEVDELGAKTRPVAPYEPIYIAGFIEDKFSFDDLIFRIGLRLDRFDANQPVLKDRFSLFPTRNVAYVKSVDQDFNSEVLPSNIGDNFIVYVDDIENPSADGIVGYRDPASDRFFNALGEELNDPTVLQAGSSIAPWLVEPGNKTETQDLNSESFEDYKPIYILMPRISFSFPISDEATFFANYDIKTRRPAGTNVFNPTAFLFMSQGGGTRLSNPNLEPSKTISYEIGFKQKLTNHSALTLSADYNEQRDDIQVRRLVGAFPIDYQTFDNIDFGTVKGFHFEYELRARRNLFFNIKYSLQFAEGTGSGTTSAAALINSGQPNLRSVFPFAHDRRHNVVTTIDYRYSGGSQYNGPKINGKNILENTGLNLILTATSGAPYTARSLPGSTALFGGSQTVRPRTGDINGSRLPWTLYSDARIDKSFVIKWGDKTDANETLWKQGKKQTNVNVYLQVFNILDRKNVNNVDLFTGNPNDDGFLEAPQFQDQISQQISEQSFRDLYTLKLNSPGAFDPPRRIRLGVVLSF